jgi:hypothetical protein
VDAPHLIGHEHLQRFKGERYMRNVIRLTVLLALVAVACEQTKDYLITEPSPVSQLSSWQASLAGLPARPQAAGTVTGEEYGSFITAEASVTGLLPDSLFQWRLYYGTCAQRIGNFGPNANPPAYTPIRTDATGAASNVPATVAGRLRSDSTYHVRIYVFTTVAPIDTVWYACGDVTGN